MAATARQADCGPRALLLLCQRAGVRADLADLRREAGTTAQGTTLAGLAQAARAHGFRAQGVQMNPQALSELSRPALAWVEADHYVAVLSVNGDQATIYDPNQPKEETISTTELWSRCGGVLLTLSR
jgi:ABC-type bacteriocin/lantibiotic exporter with double-glycine peptidase domain